MNDAPDKATATVERPTSPRREPRSRPEKLTPWNVVLHDDNDHTYPYVVEMLQRIFGRSFQDAFLMAQVVDQTGRVICETTHRERAELKREQILAWGPDVLLARSTTSMRATIEPAESK